MFPERRLKAPPFPKPWTGTRKKFHPPKRTTNGKITRISIWKNHPLAKRASIRGNDMAAYRDERIKASYFANTIRLELAIISHLFEMARKEWGMEGLTNPVKAIRMPSPLLPSQFSRTVPEPDGSTERSGISDRMRSPGTSPKPAGTRGFPDFTSTISGTRPRANSSKRT